MSNPQQPELARSRKTPHQDQDAVAGVVEGQRQPGTEGPRGPVPPENQPGHHPPREQDKPDLEAFAERMGISNGPSQDGDVSEERTPPPVRPAPSPPLAEKAKRSLPRALTATLLLVLAGLFIKRRRAKKRRRS